MLSYQSADHLDYMRRTHGLGDLPDQLMSFGDVQQVFPLVPKITDTENNKQNPETRKLNMLKEQLLLHSGNTEVRKKIALDIALRLKDGSAPEALTQERKCKEIIKTLSLPVNILRTQKINNYVESKSVYEKYISALTSLDDFSTESVVSVLDFLRGKDVAKSEKEIKQESRKLAIDEGNIGLSKIEGWELEDVDDEGNCFL